MSKTFRNNSILFFIESGGPGGAEQVVLGLAKGFKERGHSVSVATLRTGWFTEQLAKEKIEHIQIKSSRGIDIGLIRSLARLAKERNAVLHSHLLDSNFYSALASKLFGIPHIGTEHGDVHHIEKKGFFGIKIKTFSFLKTKISAVSLYSAKRLRELGLSEKQTPVIGNPISKNPLNKELRKELRDSLEISDECWAWIHVANHRKVKDQKTLLQGFAKSLTATKKEQVLLLIGDGPERDSLEKTVDELKIREHVQFLGFRDDVNKLLNAADGFILSSKSEALPMSLLEAAMSNLVLISTAVGGIPDIIKHGESGWLFQPGQSDELSKCIELALSKEDTTADAAQEYVERHFETQKVLSALQGEYDLLVEG